MKSKKTVFQNNLENRCMRFSNLFHAQWLGLLFNQNIFTQVHWKGKNTSSGACSSFPLPFCPFKRKHGIGQISIQDFSEERNNSELIILPNWLTYLSWHHLRINIVICNQGQTILSPSTKLYKKRKIWCVLEHREVICFLQFI